MARLKKRYREREGERQRMIKIVFTILIDRTRKFSQAAQLRYVCVCFRFLSFQHSVYK